MNLEKLREQNARKRALAPSLYGEHGTLNTTAYPGSIKPPEWMCRKHAASWRKWTDYRPYSPIVLMSVGKPIPPEQKRREAIAEQREVIAEICHNHTVEVPE